MIGGNMAKGAEIEERRGALARKCVDLDLSMTRLSRSRG